MTINIDKLSGSGVLDTAPSGEIENNNKQNGVNNTSEFNKGMVDDISKKSSAANDRKNKPSLNRSNTYSKGNADGKENVDSKDNAENKNKTDSKGDGKKNRDYSLNELRSLLSDFYSEEKFKINSRAHGYNLNFIKELWSESKENQLSEMILESGDFINDHIEATAEYYFSLMNGDRDSLEKMPDGELKNKLTGKGDDKFKNKDEILSYLRKKTNADEVIKNINTDSEYCKDRTKLFKSFSEELVKLPVLDDELGRFISGNRDEINSELISLHEMADIQDEAKDILKDFKDIFVTQRKNDTDYSNFLTVLMGKLSDLRDKLSQRKLDNDRLIASAQQKALQDKTDANAAEMDEKIKKAEFLQALFKWLGPLIIALMVILTALTGGLLAQVLAVIIVVVTIVSEIVKAAGGPDIMGTLMTPVTKLVEAVQKSIKDLAMKLGKALGLSPEKLKKLEEDMEIASMVLAVVVVMAIFMAAGSIAGKVIGQVASETVKEVLRQILAEVKKILITMMLTSTVVNGANSIAQAEINKGTIELQADIDLDQELLDKIMELMERIMATFVESKEELTKLKEKIMKIGKNDFQRKKSIIQPGPLTA